MAGRFTRDNRPILPGGYFNVEAVTPPSVAVATGQVVAIPIVHPWGPSDLAVTCGSLAEFDARFGADASAGRMAVHNAFRGEDIPGWGGAGSVIAYRMTGSAGAKASKILQNTTPATAVTLTARYEGTKGNNIFVAVIDNAANSANTDLVIYLGTVEVERYTFTDADTQGLVDQINGVTATASAWVTAVRAAAGPLTLVGSPSALTGGNDGSTLAGGDWTAAMTALETQRFGVFAAYDMTDPTIIESIRVWAGNLSRTGRPFRTVIGAATNDTASTAVTRSVALQDTAFPDSAALFVNLGEFVVTDDLYGNLNASQMAPRFAGILAQRGVVHSATAARLGGVSAIVSGPTRADLLTLFKGGVVSVERDSDATAPVKFSGAVTAYTKKASTIDAVFPYTVYRNPKFVATMQGIEVETTTYAESFVIGKTKINNKTRDAVRGEMMARLLARVVNGIIQPNPTVDIDQNPPPSDLDEFIALIYGIKFGRTAEQVFGTLRVG